MKVLIGRIGLRISFVGWVISVCCAAHYAVEQDFNAFLICLIGKVISLTGMAQFGVGLWMAKELQQMDNTDQAIEEQAIRKHNKIYFQGVRAALKRFAWWRDGEEFVGNQDEKKFVGCGVKSLKQALSEVDEAERKHNESRKLAGT